MIGSDHLPNALFVLLLLLFPKLRERNLRVAPVVEDAHLMHALDRAGRRAPFFGLIFTLEVFHRVVLERDAGIAALLRAPVDLPFFANVEVTRA